MFLNFIHRAEIEVFLSRAKIILYKHILKLQDFWFLFIYIVVIWYEDEEMLRKDQV